MADQVNRCAFDASGDRLVAANGWNHPLLLDRAGRRLMGQPPGAVHSTRWEEEIEWFQAWSEDGERIVSLMHSANDPRIRDRDGRLLRDASERRGTKDNPRRTVAWIPGTERFLVADVEGARVWDQDGEEVARWPETPYVDFNTLTWNGQGTRLLAGETEGRATLWSADGKRIATIEAPEADAGVRYDWAWHPAGDRFARTAGPEGTGGAFPVGPTSTWSADGVPGPDGRAGLVTWSPDGRRQLLRTPDGFAIEGPDGERHTLEERGPAESIYAPPFGDLFLATYADAEVIYHWEGREVADVAAERGRATAVCWDPKGEIVAIGTNEGEIRLLELRDDLLLARARTLAPEALTAEESARFLE